MSETRNIVILGASFAGLGCAHYVAKHILPKLAASKDANYALHIVDPSSHFWWHNAAPRAIVSVKEMKHEDCFVPIRDAFKQYTNLQGSIIFHQGAATALDTETRMVTIKTHELSETLPYHALVIATGVRSPTPLTTFHGDYTTSQKALEEMNVKLASAKDIVIGGGGPIAVETAGEIATHLGKKAKVTLVSGSDKLLPVLSKKLSVKAQGLLEKAGASVVYNTRVESSQVGADGKTELKLSNGEILTADVYIPATGVTPNTDFLPADLKNDKGYVKTNGETLRVDAAGSRVYAAGDVAGVDLGGVLCMFTTIPILGNNIAHDLLAEAKLGNIAEKKHTRKDAATQLVPVGAKTGVGAFNGWSLPGFAVAMVKGKNYMLNEMPKIYEGKQWQKA
ncbi:Hypothetical protein R9X50_00216200 [Acrodontium crateriforme]|uniref:FAD/NAD(P)-binding domain-containing protein n=1 Tax=Acrodontium crateriforme TaxID=150365 RepID=A0AAQ3M0Q9_9PEZI|nr:Hypothetical protein R9X50_00216200 [Acrodontium crateriforme]